MRASYPINSAPNVPVIGVMVAVMQGGVVRRLIPIFGESKLALAGFGLFTAGFLLLAASWIPWWVYPAVGLIAVVLGAMTIPASAQLSLAGVWADRITEDNYERSGGPPLGDYQGIPLSDAGRKLFQASRVNKQSANDADRLRKYLQRFGLDWHRVARGSGS